MGPARRPEITTWPTMAGVIRTLTAPPRRDGARRRPGGRAVSLSLAPLRSRVAHLAARQLVRPDHHPLAVLPLEHDHLVGDLEAVRLDLLVPERGLDLHLQELLAYPVVVHGSRPLHRPPVHQAARVPRPRVAVGLTPRRLAVDAHPP